MEMTILREAAQQALESIDWLRHHLIQHHGCLHMDPTASGIPAWLNKNEAALRAALAQQANHLTIERLRVALVASRIIPPAAVEDPDEYDDGLTLFRIEALHRRLT